MNYTRTRILMFLFEKRFDASFFVYMYTRISYLLYLLLYLFLSRVY